MEVPKTQFCLLPSMMIVHPFEPKVSSDYYFLPTRFVAAVHERLNPMTCDVLLSQGSEQIAERFRSYSPQLFHSGRVVVEFQAHKWTFDQSSLAAAICHFTLFKARLSNDNSSLIT